jgi:hypothetical protein
VSVVQAQICGEPFGSIEAQRAGKVVQVGAVSKKSGKLVLTAF